MFWFFKVVLGNVVEKMKSGIMKHKQTSVQIINETAEKKVLRNTKYSFICMSVVPQFQGMVDFIIKGSFPRSRRK